MKKTYTLLAFCFLIFSIFVSCDDPEQLRAITITLDSGVLGKKATTISTVENKEITLPSGGSIWETDDYSFLGWATIKDGDVSYQEGAKFSSSSDVTLYAVWNENSSYLLYTLIEDGNTYSVKISSTNISGNIIIPSTYLGKAVTTIEENGFKDCSSITKVTIPESVTEIGGNAFYNCTSLKSITIPESVTQIGQEAFGYCTSLKSIVIPKNVTEIALNSLKNCSNLKSIYVDKDEDANLGAPWGAEGATVIWKSYFSFTSNGELKRVYSARDKFTGDVVIPSKIGGITVSRIARFGFEECEFTSVTLPETVEYIGIFGFSQCTKLTSLIIPNSVTSMGYSVFLECEKLETVTLSGNLTSIADSTFNGCRSLKEVEIPDSVTSLGNYVFEGCSSLSSINLPQKVTSIGNRAFRNCSSLKSINIPDSVTSIGGAAFAGCSSLTDVVLSNRISSLGSSTYEYYDGDDSDEMGRMPDPESYKTVTVGFFEGCSALTSITLPESITSIGEQAFFGCTALESIVIPSSVETIAENAFSGCTSLKTITINKTENSISGAPWGEGTTGTVIEWKP